MTIKASAGSALILAAGLLVGFAGPLPAIAAGAAADSAEVSKSESATSGKSAKTGSRYLKKRSADRKSTHAASKSTESKKADEKQVADASGSPQPAMPEWLANANAQMTSTDAAPDTAKAISAAMSEKANTVLQQAAVDKPADAEAVPADAAVVASDQLNDVDRALQEENPSTSTQTVAMASARSASEAPDQAASNDSSTLDKTSLIGKIFIAFGALLTMASAARMFMA
ncbi:hypothetical protein [Bradyrhizobium valentinum]|uniref:Uncharacterized protein n=1 Tax=Bradyrhizobium valentinum TaxID=1518501 RepID=A0A0R3KXK2_9BRAD|nr:hypothetical protein [Bradyrhizobium valentinum]KRQ97637.1 hypothetical protein CQ10_28770 [Bradyrhizobium valentinum]KRR02680.1 hypothetical protein CP49_40250 [Bradyrhizobium valentinum]